MQIFVCLIISNFYEETFEYTKLMSNPQKEKNCQKAKKKNWKTNKHINNYDCKWIVNQNQKKLKLNCKWLQPIFKKKNDIRFNQWIKTTENTEAKHITK